MKRCTVATRSRGGRSITSEGILESRTGGRRPPDFALDAAFWALSSCWSAAFLSYRSLPIRPFGTSGRAATLGRGDPPFPQAGFASAALCRTCDHPFAGPQGPANIRPSAPLEHRPCGATGAHEGVVDPRRRTVGSSVLGLFLWFVPAEGRACQTTRNEHSFS